ncbi:MAG: hypothetical protein GYB65_07500 [Chloroflexi bacterium]|nr:hypothetical protein [Chloroflexota bacterium]
MNDRIREMSPLGRVVVAAIAIIAVFIVLNIVMKILEALVGIAVIVLVIGGAIWIFQRFFSKS